MPKKWTEVSSSLGFQSLDGAQRRAARDQYFSQVVAPQVAPADLEKAKTQFLDHTQNDVSDDWGDVMQGAAENAVPAAKLGIAGATRALVEVGDEKHFADDEAAYREDVRRVLAMPQDTVAQRARAGLAEIGTVVPQILDAGVHRVAKIPSAVTRFFNPDVVEDLTSYAAAQKQEMEENKPDTGSTFSPKNIAYTGVTSLVQQAPLMIAAAATKNPGIALAPMSIMSGGQTYDEQRAKGKDPFSAGFNSTLAGLAEAAGEHLPLDEVLKVDVGSFIRRAIKTGAKDAVGEAFTQTVQDAIQVGSIDPNMTVGQMLEDISLAAVTGQVSGMATGVLAHPVTKRANAPVAETPPPADADLENIAPSSAPPGSPPPPAAPGSSEAPIIPVDVSGIPPAAEQGSSPTPPPSSPPPPAGPDITVQSVATGETSTPGNVSDTNVGDISQGVGAAAELDEVLNSDTPVHEIVARNDGFQLIDAETDGEPDGKAWYNEATGEIRAFDPANPAAPPAAAAPDVEAAVQKTAAKKRTTRAAQEQAAAALDALDQSPAPAPGTPEAEAVAHAREQLQATAAGENGDGTAAAPMTVAHELDVARATEGMDEAPTPGKRTAGNYRKGHIKIGGMDLAIENPRGSTRRSHPEDPVQWEVTMPADYGYVKGTKGADGEHVDAYVGRNPASGKVFVLDQYHSDTGAFDEHKAFIGYDSAEEAMADYEKAFSDGRAGERVKTPPKEMTVVQFKNWAKKGDTTKPVNPPVRDAAAEQAAQRAAAEQAAAVEREARAERARQREAEAEQRRAEAQEAERQKAEEKQRRKAEKEAEAQRQRDEIERNRAEARERWDRAQKFGESAEDFQRRSDEYTNRWREQFRRQWEGKARTRSAPHVETFDDVAADPVDGRFPTDGEGNVLAKTGLLRFGDQKQAAKWILTTGHKQSSQTFEIANGDRAGVFVVRERPQAQAASEETAPPAPLSLPETPVTNDKPDRVEQTIDKPAEPAPAAPEAAASAGDDRSAALRRPQVQEDTVAHFEAAALDGHRFASITQARHSAARDTEIEVPKAGTEEVKVFDELIEEGFTRAARKIVAQMRHEGATNEQIYDRLVKLNDQQPALTQRTGKSIRLQAYSTPSPIAFVASRLAGVTPETTVYEPTAGNGALLVDATPENVTANEVDPVRAATLRRTLEQATVTEADAVDSVPPGAKTAQAVIMNPPFGTALDKMGRARTVKIDGGFSTTQIDQAIALRQLEAMADDGSAVLIMGSNSRDGLTDEQNRKRFQTAAARKFFKKLYADYGVVDHFVISGDLYKKQGAAYPLDVLVIRGRGTGSIPLPGVKAPRIYRTFESLKPLVTGEEAFHDERVRAGFDQAAPAVRPGDSRQDGNDGADDAPAVSRPDDRADRGDSGTARKGRGGRADRVDDGERGVRREPASRPDDVAGVPGADDRSVRDADRVGDPVADRPASDSEAVDQRPTDDGDVADAPRPSADRRPRRRVEAEDAGRLQIAYKPTSKGKPLDTLVPTNMLAAIDRSLNSLEDRVGNIDSYVAKKLGYPSKKEMFQYFGAEQIEALAMAIDNIERGNGFIIGDQTGVGKGRVNAGILRYAMKAGVTPIFVSERPGLFGDMYRDLHEIGVKDFNAFVTNTDLTGKNAIHVAETGTSIASLKPAKLAEAIMKMQETGKLPDGYDFLFTTYSQLQSVKGKMTERQMAFDRVAEGAIIALDESHNAGGQGKGRGAGNPLSRAAFIRACVQKAKGVFYSSATYAKNADVMDLYSRTDIRKAVENLDKLPEIMARGGVPMQQVVANMLVDAGQYVRRERSFDGISMQMREVSTDERSADRIASLVKSIFEFDQELAGIKEKLDAEVAAEGDALAHDNAVGEAGISSVSFASKLHNLMAQVLMALKTQDTVAQAIALHRAGEKPVIAVANTMQAFLQDYADSEGLKNGDRIPSLTINGLFQNYLRRTREYTVKGDDEKKSERRYIDDGLMKKFPGGAALVRKFNDLEAEIAATDIGDLPASPLDMIHYELERAGLKSSELTGRTLTVKYQADGDPILTARESKDAQKKRDINDFNSGKLDVLILNKGGATGFSIHASEKFSDQKPRHMLVLQADANIDTFMQMLGRINRTGQVKLPKYSIITSSLPAEKRPMANLMGKMASLNANTTANKTGNVSVEGVDFLNKYGDEVVHNLLMDEPDLARLFDIRMNDEKRDAVPEGLARKATGRLVILTVAEQARIYDQILTGYNELLAHKDALGENELEARDLDLRAKSVEELNVPGSGATGPSPFEQGVELHRMRVRKLVKPYKWDQVNELVEENLGGKSAADHNKALFDAFLADTAAGFEEIKKKRDALHADPDAKTNDKMAATTRLQNAEFFRAAIKSFLGQFYIGKLVQLKGDGVINGVILDVVRKPSNSPVSLGQFRVRLALTEGAREITVPLSQLIARAGGKSQYQLDNTYMSSPTLERIFNNGQSDTFEERFIATGNLLKAADKFDKGRIIFFTKEDGTREQGILMPLTFKAKEEIGKLGEPIADGAQLVEFLQKAYRQTPAPISATTGDGSVDVVYDGHSWKLKATRTKARGVVASETLERLTGSSFTGGQRTPVMTMRLSSAQLAGEAADFITNTFGKKWVAKQSTDVLRDVQAKAGEGPKYARRADAAPAARKTQKTDPLQELPVEPLTKEAREKAAPLLRALQQTMKNTFGAQVDLQVFNRLFDPQGAQVDAYYIPRRTVDGLRHLIRLSLDAGGLSAFTQLQHEGLHMLMRAGAFTEKQLAAMRKDAAAWMEKYGIRETYAGESEAMLEEEAIVHAYTEFSRRRAVEGSPSSIAAFRLITRFLQRLGAALRGQGFTSAEQIFADIYEGKFRQGEPAQTEDSPRFARKKKANRNPPVNFSVSATDMFDYFTDEHLDLMQSIKKGFSKEALSTTLDMFRTKLQDSFLPFRRYQAAIEEELGRSLDESEDVYLAEMLYTGRAGEKLERNRYDYQEPILERVLDFIKRTGKDLAYVERYLYAKHAPERNEQIAKINPHMPDGGSGMSTKEAEALLDEARREGYESDLEEIFRRARQLLDNSLKERFDGGLIDKRTYETFKKTYKNYIPLRGLAEVEGDSRDPGFRTGRGYNVKGQESQRALGRKSRATNLLAQIFAMADEAVIRSEKNRIGQALLELATNVPNEDVWEVDKVVKKPVLNKETGLVEYRSEAYSPGTRPKDDTIFVKKDGEQHRITLKDRRLALAMNKASAGQMNLFCRIVATFMRYLSTVHTGYNPEFVISNALRDLQTAMVNLQQYDLKKLARNTLRDYPLAMLGAWHGVQGKTTASLPRSLKKALKAAGVDAKNIDAVIAEWTGYFREYAAAGGRVSFWQMDDVDRRQLKFAKELKLQTREQVDTSKPLDAAAAVTTNAARFTKRNVRAFFHFVEDFNATIENSVRLSAYVNARRAGATEAEAATIAKNLTVNFNKRGDWGPGINMLYLFFNAGAQGTAVMLKALRSPRVQRVCMGIALSGFASSMLNGIFSPKDDDDEDLYDKIPEFERSSNMIFMLPGGQKLSGVLAAALPHGVIEEVQYVKIPMPYGYRFFHEVGRQIGDVTRGVKKPGAAAIGAGIAALENFNPVGGSGDFLSLATPTLGDPIVDAYKNKDFANRAIFPTESPFDKAPDPNAYTYFEHATYQSRAIAQFLNDMTGGNKYRPGLIDIHPDTLDHTFTEYVTGSTGAFISRVANFAEAVAKGDKQYIAQVPFARKVLGSVPDYSNEQTAKVRMAEIEAAMQEFNGFSRDGDAAQVERVKKEYGPIIDLAGLAKSTTTRLKKLRKFEAAAKADKESSDDARKTRLAEIAAQRKQLVDSFNNAFLVATKRIKPTK